MAQFNAAIKFAKKKKLTRPIVEVPRNIKETLNIDEIYPSGMFKIEPGSGMCMYDQCYVFEDINYANKDDSVKNTTLRELIRLFKSIKNQLKFFIASDQNDMDNFMDMVFRPLHETEYPDVAEGIGSWINQKVNEGSRDIDKVMYMTVSCYAYSYEDAASFFATLDSSLQLIFKSLQSRLYKMSGLERLVVLQKVLRLNQPGIAFREFPNTDGWKNQILPARLNPEEDGLHINERYACVLFGQDYDSTLNEEKVLYGLTQAPFPVYITVDIEPVPRRLIKDKIKNAHTNNERSIEMNISSQQKKSVIVRGPSYSQSKTKEELEKMDKDVDARDEDGLFLGLLVMVYADTPEELGRRVDQICQIADTNDYALAPYYNQQLKALNTLLPIGGRYVDCMRFLFTSSAVAFQPFHAGDLREAGGTVFGLNRITKRLLCGNRKDLSAPHGFIISHTGSGKSFFVNTTEISQTLLFTDDSLICIDPNNEREKFITDHGGQYFDFTPRCGIYINPFEVPRNVWEGDTIVKDRFVARKSEFAGRFAAACRQSALEGRVERTYVESAVEEMYTSYFENKKYEAQPTLQTMWEILKKKEEASTYETEKKLLFELNKCLESFVVGVYDMFAHQSNLDITNRLVGFGLKNIPKESQKPILLTMMHFVAERIDNNQEEMQAEHLIIEEAQVLCEDEFIADEFLYAIEVYRKVGAIVTLIVQNLSFVLRNPKLRDMFSNCPYKVFFDQGGVDAKELAEIQPLSKQEFEALSESQPGYGVLVWGGKVYLLDSRMSEENVLFPQFDTNFHKKAKKMREGAG